MSGKKKQKKKQATSRRTPKQTAQKSKNNKTSSKQEPKQTSRASSKQEPKQSSKASSKQEPKQSSKASSKPNTPKASNNQSSKANNKTTSKQEPKRTSKASSKQEPKQSSRASSKQDISVVIKKHNDSNNGHPHVILEDFEDKHVSVGLTTRKYKGTNSSRKNYRLEKDPFGKLENSYMRRQGIVDYKTNYQNPRKGKLTKKDYEQALLYGQKAKEKYIKKQQEKKKT